MQKSCEQKSCETSGCARHGVDRKARMGCEAKMGYEPKTELEPKIECELKKERESRKCRKAKSVRDARSAFEILDEILSFIDKKVEACGSFKDGPEGVALKSVREYVTNVQVEVR